jgi:hypothetical protein
MIYWRKGNNFRHQTLEHKQKIALLNTLTRCIFQAGRYRTGQDSTLNHAITASYSVCLFYLLIYLVFM